MRPFYCSFFLFYLQPNRPRLLPSPSHPVPILQVRPRANPLSHPQPLALPVLHLSHSLCVTCFLPFSHLHLDCTLKNESKKMLNSMTKTKKESMFTWSPTRLGVHWWEEPAEVILYQIQGWVEGSGATQTVVRNC